MIKKLNVFIEIKGQLDLVGCITGNDHSDAQFSYDKIFLEKPYCKAISFSLPLRTEPFSTTATKNFFEGLLPEGFSRRAVANWAKVAEEDYLSILEKLGRECLGAILILPDGESIDEGGLRKLSMEEVRSLAAEGAVKSTGLLMETHLSLTGASGKVGLYYDERTNEWYLPTGRMASTHIVKQSHVRLNQIVINEYFCMQVAEHLGIDIPKSFVINVGSGKDNEILFATKRYDRIIGDEVNFGKINSPHRLHQEDFCQALGIPASEKYENEKKSYMNRMFNLINSVSANPIEDQLKLWDLIIVNYLLGNTDCHLKNYSLLYSDDLHSVRLAPAYDIVCTRVYGTSPNMSFYIGGELDINKINRSSFVAASREVGIGERLAMKHYDALLNKLDEAVQETSYMIRNTMGIDAGFVADTIVKRYKLKD